MDRTPLHMTHSVSLSRISRISFAVPCTSAVERLPSYHSASCCCNISELCALHLRSP